MERRISRWSFWLLSGSFVLVVALALEVAARVKFPWDGYIWSESPFLTNMLKLNAGRSIYSNPSEANSFVYSPGLEYLCYVLLHPFGRDLDVRFCRVVVVALGAAACFASAITGARLLSELALPRTSVRAFLPFGAMLSALILFRNYTADVCHPDNLMALHALITFSMCWNAATQGGFRRALFAVVFGSLGVFAKQTDAGMGVAALVGLLIVRAEYRRATPAVILAFATLLTSGAAIATLLVPTHARFWTLGLLSAHPLEWEKLNIFYYGISAFYHRLLLFSLAPIALSWLFLRPEPAARRFAILWLVLSPAAAVPALLGFLKTFGAWNNLGIWDDLSALLVLPVLWAVIATSLDTEREHGSDAPSGRALASAALGILICLLLATVPTRAWPSKAHHAAARELDAELLRAHRAGERVLLAHGTIALIHAGYREVPLDRANTILELAAGKALDRTATAARITAQVYDRMYLNLGLWYGALLPLMAQNYEEVGVIRAASARPEAQGTEGLGDLFGFQNSPRIMDAEVHVFRKRQLAQ